MNVEFENYPTFRYRIIEITGDAKTGHALAKRILPERLSGVKYPNAGVAISVTIIGGREVSVAQKEAMATKQTRFPIAMIPTKLGVVGSEFLAIMSGPTSFVGICKVD